MRRAKFCGLVAIAALWLVNSGPLAAQAIPRLEFGGNYDYVHTNAPAGGCGCFTPQGGDGWMGWRWTPELSLVGQAGVQTATKISGTPTNLTLISLLGGPRLALRTRRRLIPFGEMLAGGAHGAGNLTQLGSGVSGSANVFALQAGGGLDVALSRQFLVRLVEADYFYTQFKNGTNDHQNSTRIAAGLVIRLGSRR